MRKKFVAAVIIVLVVAAIGLWLKERPVDKFPQLPEGVGTMAFNPKFGPKTVDDVRQYVDNRTQRNFRARITPETKESHAYKMARKEAVDTCKRRWGMTLEMTQADIDAVRDATEKVWAYVENTRTPRYKIRSWLGMNQQS